MKFTDGFWQIRKGMTPHYAAQVHDLETAPDSITVYAPTKKLHHRGDTLNLPLLTIRYSSPMENVVRVKVVHHKGVGQAKPGFTIHEDLTQVKIADDEKAATLTSGDLTVRIHKGEDWLAEFVGGRRVLTSSGWRALGFVDTPDGRFIHE